MALRELLAKFGTDVDLTGLTKAKGALDVLGSGLKALPGLVGVATAALGFGFLTGEIKEQAAEVGELRKTAIKLGLDIDDLQALQYSTGLSTQTLSTAFRGMQKAVASAGDASGEAGRDFSDLDEGLGAALGSKKAKETFKALKIELKDANGQTKDSQTLFMDLSASIGAIKDPSQKTAMAMRVFGRAGQDLLPFFEKSPEQIRALWEEFETVGGYTEKNAQDFKEYGHQVKLFDTIVKKLKISIVGELLPAFTGTYGAINKGIGWFGKHVDTTNMLKEAFIGLTAGVLIYSSASIAAAARTALAWLAAALPVALLYLVVDDLVHFFEGDAKTATEDLINSLYGFDEGAKIIASMRDDFHSWVDDIKLAGTALDKIKAILNGISNLVIKIGGSLVGADPGEIASLTAAPDSNLAQAQKAANGGVAQSRIGATVDSSPGAIAVKNALKDITGIFGVKEGSRSDFAPKGPALQKVGGSITAEVQTQNTFYITTDSDPEETGQNVASKLNKVGRDNAKATVNALEPQIFKRLPTP